MEIDEILPKKSQEGIKIIEKLLKAMHSDIKDLINYENLEKKSKKIETKVTRITKIALTLESTLDNENGGEISENLNKLYQHIRFAALRAYEDHDFSFLESADKVCNEINEGWTKMLKAAAA